MQNLYKDSIIYFVFFSLLLLLSSIALFEVKIGISYNAAPLHSQSLFTIIKTILPHIFGFALFLMILLHFLIFSTYKTNPHFKWLIILSFLSAFIEIFSSVTLFYEFEIFIYIKIVSFIVFELLITYILWLLFRAILYS
ncbi:hypothetical protein [Sulfurimonas sp.]